jgi:hypothetical protein
MGGEPNDPFSLSVGRGDLGDVGDMGGDRWAGGVKMARG